MPAPVVLVLGNMAVQVGSALIRKQLTKLGFRVAKDYKKFSNVTKVTKDNAANVLNKAQKLSDELRPSSRDLAKKPEIIRRKPDEKPPEAQTSIPKTNRTVNAKFDKSQKLSDFGKVGPQTPKSSRLRNVAVGAALLAPTAVGDKSPKQPNYPRTGPTPDAPVRNKPKIDRKSFKTQAGATKLKPPAIEAGFTNVDKAPPKAILERVIKPKARPTTVKKQLSAFGSAFKKARADKEYDFTFKDKKYTTRYKEETVAEHKKKFKK